MKLATRARVRSDRKREGYSLIELMVALLLAIMLGGALATAMLAQSSSNRIQAGARRVAENARFALDTIAADVRNAAHQHCMNYTTAAATSSLVDVMTDQVRSTRVLFDASAAPWSLGLPGALEPYFVDPSDFILGSECDTSTCSPAPEKFAPLSTPALALPDLGVAEGQRGMGADVLSIRYLMPPGRRVASIQSTHRDGTAVQVELAPGESVPPLMTAAIISDCGSSFAAKVDPVGSSALRLSGNFDDDVAPKLDAKQTRLFDLATDLVTVTYFLRLRTYQPPSVAPARLLSTLVRRVNGKDIEIADGIERLDFLFHVESEDGRTMVIPASEVEMLASCRDAQEATAGTGACGWRSLKGVEIHLLANSVDDATSESGGDTFRYAWLNDGSPNTVNAFEAGSEIPTLRNGLAPGRMLRKGFRTFVALRGYNH